MGAPENYSTQLPQRIDFLIEKLLPIVSAGIEGDDRFGGALSTTFLLAMATPMVVMPIERALAASEKRLSMTNDTLKDDRLRDKIAAELIKAKKLKDTSFFEAGVWSYAKGYARFDIGDPWPDDLLLKLSAPESFVAASELDARQFLIDLRNSLSHAGVAYLDGSGRHIHGGKAEMLAFSANETIKGDAYNILRIHQHNFRRFLSNWCSWLNA